MTALHAAELSAVSHHYKDVAALDDVTLSVPSGCMAGLIGPDGVGKSTLLALVAGVRKIQNGTVEVLGGDMHDPSHRRTCHNRIAYMPQGLGRNLYPTLSVFENLDFFGRLFGQPEDERRERISGLLKATGLDPFPDRPAGKLSGGMKQKLSLCSALIHDPDLLILDEPTTGVDPLSRRQFWELIESIRARRPDMSVMIATAYMEEADRFDWLAPMNAGRIIASGSPASIKERTGKPSLEQAFIAMLPEDERKEHRDVVITPRVRSDGPPAIEAEGLTRRFGDFTAVDNVSFEIERGEIFGFLGSNGCGKTTTMKMLTGLLPATEGSARLFGKELNAGDMATRQRVGYMSQSFSLYSELTVRQNLELHAQLYQLPEEEIGKRIQEMLSTFDLLDHAEHRPESIPLGIRQRLQLAVAVIHRPEILILDEPTSGVDPVARDRFWQHLIDLSRKQGVTIFISTHFMNEAERCDRISLMHAGKVLAVGKPKALADARGVATLEDAFIGYLKEAAGMRETPADVKGVDPVPLASAIETAPVAADRLFDLGRLWAYALRETMEIIRDPMRLSFAFLGPIILMLTFGYGISLDVEKLPYAVLDQDQTAESRELMESFSGSRYFREKTPITSSAELDMRLKTGELALALEIPPDFGKNFLRGDKPEVGVWLDGAMPFRAETMRNYLTALAISYVADQTERTYGEAIDSSVAGVQTRFKYNQAFKSVFAIVPAVIMLMLVLIPAMMTAMGVVREKETGSIANFYSTPVTRLEFLLGKQATYILIALISFLTLVVMSFAIFGLTIKGSILALATGTVLYVMATTGFGLLVSTFTRTQVAATFATAVISIIPAVNFSGLLVPVSSLSGSGRLIGLGFPSSWYEQISVGTFTKSLGFAELWQNHLALAGFACLFIGAALVALNKQEA